MMIAENRDLARDAALLAGGETGIVRIGVTTALTTPLLEPMVQRIAQRHPNLRIHAEVAASARLLPLLEARELDVVFVGQTPSGPNASTYVIELMLETPGLWVVSPDHPLARERGVSVARLAEFKCGGSQSPGSSNVRFMGLESENLGKYTASHYEILLPLVLRGDCALLAPTFVAQPYLEAGEMVVVNVDWPLNMVFNFVTTRAASFSPIVREIAEHSRAIGARLQSEWKGAADRFIAK